MVILAPLGNRPFVPQCSRTFFYTFGGSTTSCLFFSFFLRHSHFLWLCSPHLKHLVLSSTVSCLLTSFTPHYITLLVRALNLFIDFFFFFTLLPLFLQFLAKWPHCLHSQHSLPFLPSNSDLILVSACQVLSILLRMSLYISKNIAYCT